MCIILCTYQWFAPGNLVGNEVVHQDEEVGGGGGEGLQFDIFRFSNVNLRTFGSP